jgi:cation diffusion facilitator CzcD-associated flavoprotein CzcO
MSVTTGGDDPVDMVNDGWTNNVKALGGTYGETIAGVEPEVAERIQELRDFKRMNEIRARVDEIVTKKDAAEILKPWYRLFCKRPVWNDRFLQSFNRDNVEIIDVSGPTIERITENAIVVGGKEYEVDCIVFATGFEAPADWARNYQFEIYGRDGVGLSEHWGDGMRTFHGFYSHGFPNLFYTGIAQNGLNYNYLFGIGEQAIHIAETIKRAREQGALEIEPTAEAEQSWVDTIHRLAGANVAFFRECTPGYFNNEGDNEKPVGVIGDAYGGLPGEFYDMIRQWRQGEMAGVILS